MAKHIDSANLNKLAQSRGGKARAASLTAAQRREIAYKAAEARWGAQLPDATHAGVLVIADMPLECAVLNTGKRILAQHTVMQSIGRTGKAKVAAGPGTGETSSGLPPFLAPKNLIPFVTDELRDASTPILFRTFPSRQRAFGYDAKILPMICEVYLRARDAGVIERQQLHIVQRCDLLMRGLARVGIIALVDEATGYQEDRAKDELYKILEAYIAPELMPWTRRFPDEFFRQVYRLQGWEYKPGETRGPRYVGKLIMKYVYDQLPPGVVDELKARNPPDGRWQRKNKLYKFLTEHTGIPHLDWQISTVTTLMRGAADKAQFEEIYSRAFEKEVQLRLPLTVPALPPATP
jgi:hypothetical protein